MQKKEMKIFPIKLSINLRGVNQALYLKNLDDKIELEKVNDRGQRCTVFEFKKTTAGYMKLWFWQNKRWLTACCAIMVTACVSFYALRAISTPIEERLYNRHYEKMGDHDKNFFVEGDALNEAKRQYTKGAYNTALIILDGLPDNNSIYIEKSFYHALSLMGNEKYMDAINEFQQIIDKKGFTLPTHPTAYWYMSLCYVRLGEFDRAETCLRKLNKNNLKNYKEAKQLLKRIEKIKS